MLNINLLPWREQSMQHQLRTVKYMMIITGVLLLTCTVLLHKYLNDYLNYTQQKIVMYQAKLHEKMHFPQRVRRRAQNLLPSIKTILLSLYSPHQQICFNELIRQDKKILIKGTTNVPAFLVQNLMHLKLAQFFPRIIIREIKPIANHQTYFVLETKYVENL